MRTRQMLRLARATLFFLLMVSTTGASFQKRSVGKYGRNFQIWVKTNPLGNQRSVRLTAKHFGDLWG